MSKAKKQRHVQVRQHLIGMLETTDAHGLSSLNAILEGGDIEEKTQGPVLLQHQLKSASRVLRAIHLNETSGTESMSLRALREECDIKNGRSRRAWRGLYFIMFFGVYAITLILQRNGPRGEQAARATTDYFVRQEYYAPTSGSEFPDKDRECNNLLGLPSHPECNIPMAEYKTFLDMVTMEDFWDWLQLLMIPRFYQTTWDNGDVMEPSETNTMMRKLRPIHGPRLVLARSVPGSQSVSSLDGGCWAMNDGDIRTFAPECYDSLAYCPDATCAVGRIDNSPYGTFSNQTKYFSSSFKTGYAAIYPEEKGYFQMLPDNDRAEAERMVREIKQDRWIDKSTQWFRVDMTYLNADERLYAVLRLQVMFDNTGVVIPVVTTDTYQQIWYDFANWMDSLRLILEISVLVLWAVNVHYAFQDFLFFKKHNPEMTWWQAFHGVRQDPGYSYLRDIQLWAFTAIFLIWLLVIVDPFGGDINVYADHFDWNGSPIFFTVKGFISRGYFILNGIITFLFVLRIIQIARLNPRFSLLSEALDAMKYRLFNFAIVLFLLLLFFTFMAMMLFGDKVAEFSDVFTAVLTTTQTLIGSGTLNDNQARRGGGKGAYRSLDYEALYAVSPRTAWLWYYPFVFMMVLVVINITIAIIGDAYVRVKKHRDPNDDEVKLCPTEVIAGHPTTVPHQLGGAIRRIWKDLFHKEPVEHLRKEHIVRTIDKLHEDIDMECILEEELLEAISKYGVSVDDINWLKHRYPMIVNTIHDLEDLMEDRTPNPPGAKSRLEAVAGNVEDAINAQAAVHAQLDLLIRMATV